MTDCSSGKCWCKKIPLKEPDADAPPLLHDLYTMAHKIEHLYDGIEKCFEKIEKNEELLRRGWMAEMYDALTPLIERIEKLEGYMEMEDRVTASDILIRLTKIEQHFAGDYQLVATKLTPHKCPICDAKGVVHGIENNIAWGHKCKTCDGDGLVWG